MYIVLTQALVSQFSLIFACKLVSQKTTEGKGLKFHTPIWEHIYLLLMSNPLRGRRHVYRHWKSLSNPKDVTQDRTQDLRSDSQWFNQLSYHATFIIIGGHCPTPILLTWILKYGPLWTMKILHYPGPWFTFKH
jgi:hypothetical protein